MQGGTSGYGTGWLWTPQSGKTSLGYMPSGHYAPIIYSGASGISDDGNTISGGGSSNTYPDPGGFRLPGDSEALKWISSEGWQGLGDILGDKFASAASGVSEMDRWSLDLVSPPDLMANFLPMSVQPFLTPEMYNIWE